MIVGASRPEQLEENLGALDVVERMTPAVMGEINRCRAQLPRRRLFRIPGGRRLLSLCHALGLR